MPSAPPILWVLGCLALLFWLWGLCTACYRYVCPLSGFHVEPGSALWPEGAGLQAGPPWTKGWGPRPPSLLPWPHHPLAPRKRARRQQAELQGSVVQVSARLSPGPGWGQHGTDQPSLPPVTAEAAAPLLPQQVGHQTA